MPRPSLRTLVLFLLAASAAGQDRLPADGFFPGWIKSGPSRTFVRQDLFNHIDGGAELYLEFGFERVVVQPYTNGKAEVVLEAYEMTTSLAALGIYLFQAGRESAWPDLRARNSSEETQAAVLKGRFFIRINNFDSIPGARPVMAALANAFLSSVPEEETSDPFRPLPAEGRVPGSERLIRGPLSLQPYFTFGEGDILSQGGKIFGLLAEYRAADGSTYDEMRVDYGDEKAQAAAYSHLSANLDPYLKITERSEAGFSFLDFQGRRGVVERRGTVLNLRFRMKS
ncbi:MAG: hypothetical protein FJY80_13765, partial [Candidatus Aminicenantes bacterium]|nr:hypothetical protein [Candidatus Aminicenantes bacterium]